MLIISRHIDTSLNYLTAALAGSDFYVIPQFPEVYHAHGITTAPFQGGERPVTGQGRGTTYMVTDSWKHRYILCFRAAARRRG
ncbi:hypothetical protein E5AUHO_44440 [Citrobacter freundii]|nr:hypothetical protein E5AUHO_44440 [Citrobacter freundii]